MKTLRAVYKAMIFSVSLVLVMGIGSMNFAYGEGETTDTTAPEIDYFHIQNADNIDSQEGITIDFGVTEEGSGWSSINATFVKHGNTDMERHLDIHSWDIDEQNSLFSGNYSISMAMPTYENGLYFSEEGEYELVSLTIWDKASSVGNQRVYSGEALKDICDTPVINVTNVIECPDTIAPQINSVELLTTGDVDAAGSIQVKVDLTEDGSGVVALYCELADENGDNVGIFGPNELLELYTDIHILDIPLNGVLRNGRYTLESIHIQDVYNQRIYSYDEINLKSPFEFNIVNSTIDPVPPQLNSISIKQGTLKLPGVLDVDVDITEEETGVGQIILELISESDRVYQLSWPSSSLSEGASGEQLHSGLHTVHIPVGPFFENGSYRIKSISLGDKDNNTVYENSNIWGDEPTLIDDIQLTLQSDFDVAYFLSIENTNGIINTVNSMNDGEVAVIDSRDIYSDVNNHIIPKEVFEAMAGKPIILVFQDEDVQWVFNGLDVDPNKCKDVDITTNIHVENGEKTGFANDDKVLVVDFMDNGELPGEAEVRINNAYISAKYASSVRQLMLSYVEGEKITVEDEHVNIESDEAAVLHIDHNSRFVLSSNGPIKTISAAVIKVNDCVFTGKALNPSVTVVMGSKTLTRQRDYTISMSNNTKVGTARVVVKGVGNYKGTKTKNFNINPKKAAISKVKAGKKKITVKMKTKPSALGASSYKIEYRIVGSGAWKSTTTSGKSKTIKKLKKGKKYQVRVIAYSGARQGAASATKKTGKVK